jgi:prophage antirepressor-like protein
MDLIRYGYNGKLFTILQDHKGNPWWVAREVCTVLGIADPKSSTRFLESDEKGVHSMHTPGGKQNVTIVNEPGLYTLIFQSRKPEAKTFKRWVTHEVLPAIRKTGAYHYKEANRRGRPRKEPEDGYYGDILKEQRQLHQIFEHAYKIARRMTSSSKEASIMARTKVAELTGIDLAESYHLPPGMKSRAETEKEIIDGFVHDCCLVGDEYQVPATELYQAFRNWFEHNRSGEVPTQKWFGGRMGRRFKRKKDNTYKYYGIDLKRTILTDEGYVRDFIEECCSPGEDLKVSLKVLYERFSEFYLKRTGQVPLPMERFTEVLAQYFSIEPNAENILSGIGLLPVPPSEE